MFHPIPEAIRTEMARLEKIDARDREDGTPRMQRLRQIPPETGRFLALLAANTPKGALLEIGTSAGYSTLWLALAALESRRTVTTFEILPDKAELASETFQRARVTPVVKLVEGDALTHLSQFPEVAFCFLDAEKEVYKACYDAVIPNLVQGGYLAADNAINHRETLQPMLDDALEDNRVDAMVATIGKGLLICRKR